CLARRQPQPCREVAAARERASVADRRHQSCGGEDPDPWDRDQPAGGLIGAGPPSQLLIECRHPLVGLPPPPPPVRAPPPQPRPKTAVFVRQDLRQQPLELAPSLRAVMPRSSSRARSWLIKAVRSVTNRPRTRCSD